MTLQQLRKKYPHLNIGEKAKVKDKYDFLRWQACEPVTQDVILPAIYKVRDAVSATVTFAKLVAFSDSLDGLAETLCANTMKEAA